jgi:hypothetical protein
MHSCHTGCAAGGSATVRHAQPALRGPSCKPTDMSAWSGYRSEAALILLIDTTLAVFS